MGYTKEQEQAIKEGGKNIIVSAGAGSGKTQVLTQRILRHVVEGVDIRRLLVLTFTKAAAKEMKERVSKLLAKNNFPIAMEHLDSTYITTFDSFSLSIVKKYSYLLSLENNVKVADEGILLDLKKQLIEEYFLELYKKEDKDFFRILERYTDKDDKQIQFLILSILATTELQPNENEFFANTEQYYTTEHRQFLIESIESYAKEEFEFILGTMMELRELCDENNLKLFDSLQNAIDQALNLQNYKDFQIFFTEFDMPRLAKNTGEDLKSLKKDLTDQIKKYKLLFSYESPEEAISSYFTSKEDALYIFQLAQEINTRLQKLKQNYNYHSFADIAKMAIQLVREFPSVCEELKEHFYEILIDEYQDTSDLQETFISQIANQNVYMVGDIKQSIYRFRNANPYIFKNKYETYKSSLVDLKIDLTKNFRSRKEVIEDFNLIFNAGMTDQRGDANYALEHQMSFGLTGYEDIGAVPYDSHMEIRRFMIPEEFTEEGKIIKPKKVDNDLAQMVYIAKDIKKKMETYYVLHKEDGYRKVKYKDFCILISSKTKFQTMKKVLEYFSIPVTINANLDLKDSLIAVPLCNLLKVILYTKHHAYDSYYRHALASVLRSFIFSYRDDQIFKIIKLKEKDSLFTDFYFLAKESEQMSIIDFVDFVLEYFNVYEKIISIGGIKEANVEIDRVKTILEDYIMLGYDEITACTKAIEILKSDTKIEYPNFNDPDADMVQIMTIHKSKGLEYPICYFPFLNSKFNLVESKLSMGFNAKFGMFMPEIEGNLARQTILKNLIVHDIQKQEISERVRVFYVALTRAREKMVLLYTDNNVLKPKRVQSFRDILKQAKIDLFTFHVDPREYQIGREYAYSIVKTIEGGKEKLPETKFDFSSKPLVKRQASTSLDGIMSLETKRNIELGLRIHGYLEQLDLKNPELNLISDNFIKEKLDRLLKLDLFAKIKEAKVFQEHEFYFQSKEGFVHGIIDLFLQYEEHIDLIDYKLSNTDKEEYQTQLALYKEYLRDKTGLPVNVYLISVLASEVTEVDV